MECVRCDWAHRHPLEQDYHDTYWGVPVYDDLELFKMLMLECNQAGLSWTTIIKRMDSLCEAYDNFDPHILVTYDDQKVQALMQNEGIIRNRLKINAAITNAHAYFKVCEAYGSFSTYLWSFVGGTPIMNHPKTHADVPATTDISDALSKSLKKLGFKFVGSTIVYAFMQAVGMVNDHVETCAFKYTLKD
ncbi:DNA-3-methyladenine glycosylase (plasmid) [Erysipelothrix larvae]|uniref:DNA-3-methyladenine glycosylase n=1 Tax=Erysipelothrix larvae TaxID=1514105 RepID=A0A0X8H0F7_9FIRM|nr:DNA-3-methyladenine glycosylase I [Erysipelothrix larvae]AMC93772.1 DNA-3-methyladenine glycosylase [Erysipelothrix larvae]AMC94684.1 DNA-3-methyladenine glycosylase [Erysipelothrix larvae]